MPRFPVASPLPAFASRSSDARRGIGFLTHNWYLPRRGEIARVAADHVQLAVVDGDRRVVEPHQPRPTPGISGRALWTPVHSEIHSAARSALALSPRPPRSLSSDRSPAAVDVVAHRAPIACLSIGVLVAARLPHARRGRVRRGPARSSRRGRRPRRRPCRSRASRSSSIAAASTPVATNLLPSVAAARSAPAAKAAQEVDVVLGELDALAQPRDRARAAPPRARGGSARRAGGEPAGRRAAANRPATAAPASAALGRAHRRAPDRRAQAGRGRRARRRARGSRR